MSSNPIWNSREVIDGIYGYGTYTKYTNNLDLSKYNRNAWPVNVTDAIKPYFIVNIVISILFLMYFFAAIFVQKGSKMIFMVGMKYAIFPACGASILFWFIWYFVYPFNSRFYACLNPDALPMATNTLGND
jgi:hypothetical protein